MLPQLQLQVFVPLRNGSLSGSGLQIQIRDASTRGTLFIGAWNGRMEKEGGSIANIIVRAVNSHADLLEAAKAALEMLAEISHYVPDEEFKGPDGQNVNKMRERLESAIAKATA